MVPLVIGGIIGAAVGGIAGLAGTAQQAARQDAEQRLRQEQLKHQKETAWQSYLLNQGYADTEWGLAKDEAFSNLALNERRLGDTVDENIGRFNTGLEGQALGLQNARIETSGSIGALLAGEGASGVRGNAATGLVASYAEKSLERQAGLQERENSDSLYAMLSGAGQAREDINLERASWGEGGYKALAKEAQDKYNKDVAEQEQANIDWSIRNNAEYYNTTKINGWDYAAAFLSGNVSGWGMGTSIAGAFAPADGSAGKTDSFDGVGGGRGYGYYRTTTDKWT
jgi:gas vesicle protein